MKNNNTKKYHAFISYRHADNKDQGRQWATWLHQAIETYEVPVELVGRNNGRGEQIPARIFPIFRDEEELPANADLAQSITGALDSTRLLIVLCSPRAVASTYVADEIDYFKKLGHSDRIIAAMIDGEPNTSWDKDKLNYGFKIEDECFPIPLQFEYDKDGNQTNKHAEPIAADFRINNDGTPEQSWTSPEAYRLHLQNKEKLSKNEIDTQIKVFEEQNHLMLLKIIAGILGVPLGELTQRDKAYQLEKAQLKARNLRRWLFAITGLALLAIAAGVFAYLKQQVAEQQTQISQISESKIVAQNAVDAFNQGDYLKSIKLALSVLPKNFNAPDRAYSPDAEAILSSAVFHEKRIYSGKGDEHWNDFDSLNKDPYKNVISKDNSRLVLYGSAAPVVIDLTNGKRVELESIPTGLVWLTKVSSKARFIAAESENDEGIITYVWATLDGSLQLKQKARLSQFSLDETMVGFYKKSKTSKKNNKKTEKNIEGYLVDIASGERLSSFVGELVLTDKKRSRNVVQTKKNCRWQLSSGTQCEVNTKILSFSTGDIELEIPGEVFESKLSDNLLMLKNSSDVFQRQKDNTMIRGQRNQAQQQGVSIWNIELQQQIDFYPGIFTYFEKSKQRLFINNKNDNENTLWDSEKHELITKFRGELVPHSNSSYENKIDRLLIIDPLNEPAFLVNSGEDEHTTTIRYSLEDGKQISNTLGNYLGLHNESSILTSRRVSFETDARTVNRIQIYSEEYDIPLYEMDEHLCQTQKTGFSNTPLMPLAEGNVILFNCNNTIVLYYPNSANPQQPEILLSKSPAKWVSNGNIFWYGEDYADVLSFSYWEGGSVQSERMMRVELRDSIEFTSLLNGKYLLAQTPDSGITLWDSSGDIFKPTIILHEHEFAKDYQQYFEDLEPDTQQKVSDKKKTIIKKKEIMSELGFNFNSLRNPSKEQDVENGQEQDFEAKYQESIDSLWAVSEVFSEHPLSKVASYDAESIIDLKDEERAVIIGIDFAYLVNIKTGEKIANLYEGIARDDYFFEGFHESYGVSINPNKSAFIFYNPYGAWLFNMQGDLKLTLCSDSTSCHYTINFEWLQDKNSVFVMRQNPSIYSLDNDSQIDLCISYDNTSDCRNAFESFIIFGDKTIATGKDIFDFNSGIRILELPGELGGMNAYPSEFNHDESAILMSAESGGGMAIYGIWKLPDRGESLLKKAHKKYLVH